MKKESTEIGHVVEIYRYPVKSMRGERVDETKVGWHGLSGDRRYAFLRVGNHTGLPWLSVRQFPGLILYSPRFEDPEQLDRSSIIVRAPDGKELALESDELRHEIEDCSRTKLELVQLWRGAFDSMAISLISLSSIRSIETVLGRKLEPERFRPNIAVELLGEKAFPEDRLMGELIVFGERENSARIRIFRKDPRCMVVNLDPHSAQQNPEVLKEIVKNRKNFLGAYGGTERPGTIKAGDKIFLIK